MSCRCRYCNKIVETTSAPRVVSKTVRLTNQKRKDYLKSDFEVVHNLEDGLYCNNCGFRGGEDDFPVEHPEPVEQPQDEFDPREHYKQWLVWVQSIKDMVKGEENEREQTSESTQPRTRNAS